MSQHNVIEKLILPSSMDLESEWDGSCVGFSFPSVWCLDLGVFARRAGFAVLCWAEASQAPSGY